MATTILKLTASEKEFSAALQRASGSLGKFTADMNTKYARKMQDYDRVTTQFNRGLGRLSNTLKSISLAGFVGLSLPLGFAAKSASDAYAEFDSLKKGLQAIDPVAANINKRVAELTELAKAPALGFEQALKADVRMRTVGFSIEESTKIMREFANTVARTGGSSANLEEVTYQLTQLASKGKVLTQDLRPIIENAPAVQDALLRMFGTVSAETISEQLQKTGKSSKQFIRDLVKELENSDRVSAGWKTTLENLTDSLFRVKARIMEKADALFNLKGMVESTDKAMLGLFAAFEKMPEPIQKAILGFTAFLGIAPLVSFAFSKILDGFIYMVRTMKTTSGIIGIVATALAFLGTQYFTSRVYAQEFANATKSVNEVNADAAKSVETQTSKLHTLVKAIQTTKVGSQQYLNVKKDILAISPTFSKYLKDTEADFKGLRTAASAYALSLVAVASQEMLANKISSNESKIKELEKDPTTDMNLLDKGVLAFNNSGLFGTLATDYETAIKLNSTRKIIALRQANKAYQKELEKNIEENANLIAEFAKPAKDPIPEAKILPSSSSTDKGISRKEHTENVTKWFEDKIKREAEAFNKLEEQRKKNLETHKESIDKYYANILKKESEALASHDAKVKAFGDARIKREQERANDLENLRAEQENILNTSIANVVAGGISQMVNEESNGFKKALKANLNSLGNYAIQLGLQSKKIIALKEALFANPTLGQAAGLILGGIAIKAYANSLTIPRLANGGVTNGNPMLAMIGDNRSGKEMVLPLERTEEFANMIAGKLNGGGGGGSQLYSVLRGKDIRLILNREQANG